MNMYVIWPMIRHQKNKHILFYCAGGTLGRCGFKIIQAVLDCLQLNLNVHEIAVSNCSVNETDTKTQIKVNTYIHYNVRFPILSELIFNYPDCPIETI